MPPKTLIDLPLGMTPEMLAKQLALTEAMKHYGAIAIPQILEQHPTFLAPENRVVFKETIQQAVGAMLHHSLSGEGGLDAYLGTDVMRVNHVYTYCNNSGCLHKHARRLCEQRSCRTSHHVRPEEGRGVEIKKQFFILPFKKIIN